MSSAEHVPHIVILPDADAVARHAADTLGDVVARAAAEGRRAAVALSGGSTPQRLLRLLAGEYAAAIDWSRVEVFFGDERAVPPAHPDSNFGAARATLFEAVAIPSEQVHRMEAEAADLDRAARRYEALLRERVAVGPSRLPRLDLVWLGMGDDGHTASLFPGTAALDETSRLVVGNDVPQLGTRRMTLTFPTLAAAARIQFLVTGIAKAARAKEILEDRLDAGEESTHSPPAARVRPLDGTLEWVLDAEAATFLA